MFDLTNIHESFRPFFDKNLSLLVDIEKNIGDNFCPLKENIFKFARMDLKNLKYVIVGMEPYPTTYETLVETLVPVATGRSFEVGTINSWTEKYKQSSLRNILKTIYYNETGNYKTLSDIRTEILTKKFEIEDYKDWFNDMEAQGVMFLNATLTVETNIVGSHEKFWREFMKKLILFMNEENKDIKWFLWGKDAQKLILSVIPDCKHINTSHPRIASFVYENCFKNALDVEWTGIP